MKEDKKKVYDFAVEWLDKYMNPEIPDCELEKGFADACFTIGFEMDCGESFGAAYDPEGFHDADELRKIIDKVQDIHVLGTAIFSRWRYFTHWACSAFDREWFIVALTRLVELTK